MEESFTLSIRLGNEAMRVPGDVGGALREMAEKFENGYALIPSKGTIQDENGNTVGRWYGEWPR